MRSIRKKEDIHEKRAAEYAEMATHSTSSIYTVQGLVERATPELEQTHTRTFFKRQPTRVEIRVCGGRELLGRGVTLLNIAIAALLVLRVHRMLLQYRWHLCLAAEGCGEELVERGHLLVQMLRERTRERVDLVLAYLRRGRRRRSRMALLKRVQGRHPVLYLTESRELTQRRAIEGIYE